MDDKEYAEELAALKEELTRRQDVIEDCLLDVDRLRAELTSIRTPSWTYVVLPGAVSFLAVLLAYGVRGLLETLTS